MPRKITKKETGVYEKEPGSGVWWIRFKSNGVTRREKIGRRGDAIAAYKDRKTSILRGEKLPATMKNRGIRLREIGQDAIDWYIRTGKKDLRTFSQRMTAVMDSLSEFIYLTGHEADLPLRMPENLCSDLPVNCYKLGSRS